MGVYPMATTGELRAIIEELELVDIGDAASYLGEELGVAKELVTATQSVSDPSSSASGNDI
jgi:hypothetical protein